LFFFPRTGKVANKSHLSFFLTVCLYCSTEAFAVSTVTA